MSCMVKTVAIRAEIKDLRGKNKQEAYQFYKKYFGEANDYFDDGEFYYDREEGEINPVIDLDGNYGVEYLIKSVRKYKSGYNDICIISYSEFKEITEKITNKISGVNKEDINLVSYTWYNGVDEPIYFNSQKEDK